MLEGMGRKKIVAGNWKMNTDARSAAALMEQLVAWRASNPGRVQMIVAPPFPFLASTVEMRAGHNADEGVLVAAQNCHSAKSGAFTGEVGVPMLASLGVAGCIVGHSERRQFFGETDKSVGQKIVALLEHGLLPIYCCGELRQDREAGRHQDVVATQLHTALSRFKPAQLARVVVAYEPVWAIGTGLTATPGQAQEMHAFIRAELARMAGGVADEMPLLYGGSCKPDNAGGLFAQPDIDGGLIGGAALNAADFTSIVATAEQTINAT